MRINIGLGGIGLVLALAAGCNKSEDKGPQAPVITSSGITSSSDAVRRITTTRCYREMLCNNIGSGKTYETNAACVNEIGHDNRVDLRAAECPRGISERDLDDCLVAISHEKCANPFDSLSRLVECRRGKLCME